MTSLAKDNFGKTSIFGPNLQQMFAKMHKSKALKKLCPALFSSNVILNFCLNLNFFKIIFKEKPKAQFYHHFEFVNILNLPQYIWTKNVHFTKIFFSAKLVVFAKPLHLFYR